MSNRAAMMTMRCGTPQNLTDGDIGELPGMGQLQRNAARVGIVQSDNKSARAERGDEGVYAKF